MDRTTTAAINMPAGSHPTLDTLMIALTQFGVPLMVLLVALQWWSRDGRPHVRHVALTAGLSFLLGLGANQIILLFVHRVRPYDAGLTHLIIAPSVDWSFPSDHATAAAAIVAAFLLQGLPRRTMLLAGIGALVGYSRIYVGTHYATDIVGGALTGFAAAVVVRTIFREGGRLSTLATRIL